MALREQRRLETQRAIQTHAVRLFAERGYDATTVADVADAAGVSAMTVYRHFPTKEDLVLADQHAADIAERIAASPPELPLVRRIGGALIDGTAALTRDGRDKGLTPTGQFLLARLKLMISTPALRAKHLDNNYVLQQAIVGALGYDASEPDKLFQAEAAASACLAALHTALVRWAEEDGRPDLPGLIGMALAAAFGETVTGA
ncbi:TetR/AcrR family transcriptional regulator [Kribbella sp. CA-294648]|uniref:TetR/AcrR family transcriptional regulator n=1 Tax=Kribbella sp. CA-294648 TaxID=3239948 RepID=UPI003D94C004